MVVRNHDHKRVLILSASVGSGHNVAAAVLELEARQSARVEEVKTFDVLELTSHLYRALYDDAYFDLVNVAPWLVGWNYDVNNPPFSRQQNALLLLDQLNATEVVKEIERYRPDIILSTHFLPARLVSLLLTRRRLRATLSVITTDYDFQGLWLSTPFNRFFVARDETRAHMVEIGLPADRITVSGIPVRVVFSQPVEREAVLAQYQLDPDLPTLLISAGAAGGAYTREVVAQTLRMQNPFQAVVVCGRNEQLKHAIAELVASRAERYRVLGYVDDMPDLMRVASLFVGKPGGLSSSECMAAGLPMVLVKPIPGQEVRNSDFLLEEGAAVRCNYDTTIGYKIDGLIADPERIARMAANARRLGSRDAASVIVATALAEPPASLWISRDAQRSIRLAAENGRSARDADAERRVRTVVDASTGGSLGVLTTADLRSLAAFVPADEVLEEALTLTRERLNELQRVGVPPHLLQFLTQALGDQQQVYVTLDS